MLLKNGSTGTQVKYLQYGLHILNCSANTFSGTFDDATETAVRKYQGENGLTVDGIVGDNTWNNICDQIRPIQQALADRGYYTGSIDGIAGSNTYNAILEFQEYYGLTADGIVGAQTKAKLGITDDEGTSGTTSSTLKSGSNGSLVKYLQRLLKWNGAILSIDGDFGTATKNAVKTFQTNHGLESDGIVGANTWKKLFDVHVIDVEGAGATKFVNIAKHELNWGFTEDNNNDITPYGQWYGENGSAWCAMFVSWCARHAGIMNSLVPRFSYCPSGVTWYQNKSRFYSRTSGYTPKAGDTVFFWSSTLGRVNHTGIVTEVTSTTIKTIEGNSSAKVSSNSYNRTSTYIHGYGCNTVTPTELDKVTALQEQFSHLLELTNNYAPVLNYTLNSEILLVDTPYLKVSCKFSRGLNVYYNADSNIVVDINSGELSINLSTIANYLSTSIGYTPTEEDLTPALDMAKVIGDGTLKISCSYSGGFLVISLCFSSDIEITPNYSESYSYSYTIKIKEDPTASYSPEISANESYATIANAGIAGLIVGGLIMVGIVWISKNPYTAGIANGILSKVISILP